MLDKVWSLIPGTASYKDRLRSEGANDVLSKVVNRQLESAMEDRRRPYWNMFELFSNPDNITRNIPITRHRSRLLYVNDAIARGVINKDVSNVIGPGFSVQARIPWLIQRQYGLSEERLKDITDLAENYFFEKVINSKSYDKNGMLDYFQMVRLKYKTFRIDGNVFSRYELRDGHDLPFCCSIIPTECIKNPLGYSENCRDGLQFGSDGMVQGYWVEEKKNTHRYVMLPVKNKLGLPETVHYFNPEMVGINVGLPWLTAAMLLINDKSDYLNSELQSKIVEADVALVIQSQKPGEMEAAMQSSLAQNPGGGGENQKISAWPKKQVLYVNKGEEVKTVNWSRPGNTFEPFMNHISRAIGSAIGRSFEFVSNNYGAANFSATRVSGVEDALEFLCDFNFFANSAITPDWYWAMWSAALELNEPLLAYCMPDWQKFVKESWDQVKDAQAAAMRIQNGTSNKPLEAAKLGRDYEAVMEGKAKAEKAEEEYRKEIGLTNEEVEEDDSTDD